MRDDVGERRDEDEGCVEFRRIYYSRIYIDRDDRQG